MSQTLDTYLRLTDPKNEYQIPDRSSVTKEIHSLLGSLDVTDESICFNTRRLVYRPLEDLIKRRCKFFELSLQARELLGRDLMFGVSSIKGKKKKDKVYRERLEELKSLNHPYFVFTPGKITVLTESQFQALHNESPTCNNCSSLMTKKSGKFGEFFFCGNNCESQKNVSKTYWDKVRKKR